MMNWRGGFRDAPLHRGARGGLRGVRGSLRGVRGNLARGPPLQRGVRGNLAQEQGVPAQVELSGKVFHAVDVEFHVAQFTEVVSVTGEAGLVIVSHEPLVLKLVEGAPTLFELPGFELWLFDKQRSLTVYRRHVCIAVVDDVPMPEGTTITVTDKMRRIVCYGSTNVQIVCHEPLSFILKPSDSKKRSDNVELHGFRSQVDPDGGVLLEYIRNEGPLNIDHRAVEFETVVPVTDATESIRCMRGYLLEVLPYTPPLLVLHRSRLVERDYASKIPGFIVDDATAGNNMFIVYKRQPPKAANNV